MKVFVEKNQKLEIRTEAQKNKKKSRKVKGRRDRFVSSKNKKSMMRKIKVFLYLKINPIYRVQSNCQQKRRTNIKMTL